MNCDCGCGQPIDPQLRLSVVVEDAIGNRVLHRSWTFATEECVYNFWGAPTTDTLAVRSTAEPYVAQEAEEPKPKDYGKGNWDTGSLPAGQYRIRAYLQKEVIDETELLPLGDLNTWWGAPSKPLDLENVRRQLLSKIAEKA